jgi:hypothetical protein
MAQRLKSWESPRRQGRNIKGKGGSARQRQLKKQQQMLRKKLKGESLTGDRHPPNSLNASKQIKTKEKRTDVLFSFYLEFYLKTKQASA